MIPVTKEEAENLRVKLGSLENTGVEEKTYAFTVDAGDTLTCGGHQRRGDHRTVQ